MADPATEKEFTDFVEQFTAMSEDKSRMRLLKAWLTDHKLSCEQAAKVLKELFGLGDVAVKAATLMHPQLTDPNNVTATLLPAFKFDDEREDAKKALGL
eukprot:m.32069 g.32069  ORF g.32069 m.32069 type:complete len:99 (+) comp8375_c0_seq1:86-382(+)